jgi:hypothetical protein
MPVFARLFYLLLSGTTGCVARQGAGEGKALLNDKKPCSILSEGNISMLDLLYLYTRLFNQKFPKQLIKNRWIILIGIVPGIGYYLVAAIGFTVGPDWCLFLNGRRILVTMHQ